MVLPAPCVSSRCPLAPDSHLPRRAAVDLEVHHHAERRDICGREAFARQACPHIADVEFHFQIGRPIAARHQGACTLQRALVPAGCAQVERKLAVIRPQVGVEILERPIAEDQFAKCQVHFRIGVFHLVERQRLFAEQEFLRLRLGGRRRSLGGRGFGWLLLREEWREVDTRRRQLRLDLLPGQQ